MSVAGATPAQLAQLSAFVNQMRATCIAAMKLNDQVNALVLGWDANILGIIGAPQGTLINDNTGLAGAVELTDTQVTNLFGILQSMGAILTNANQQAMVLATGPGNV